MTVDHYAALGVSPDASTAEVRAAYLDAMRRNHPDRRPGDPHAANAARRANAAWEVLGDDERRAAYDRLRATRSGAMTAAAGAVTRSNVTTDLRRQAREAQAYSAAYDATRRDVHRAILRLATVVVALGFVLLTAVS